MIFFKKKKVITFTEVEQIAIKTLVTAYLDKMRKADKSDDNLKMVMSTLENIQKKLNFHIFDNRKIILRVGKLVIREIWDFEIGGSSPLT